MEKTKDKLEQAAKECANSFVLTDFYMGSDIKEAIIEAFEAGANWQKEQSPWISIDERFPDDKEQVLVSFQIYGKVVLVWDKLGMVWFIQTKMMFIVIGIK